MANTQTGKGNEMNAYTNDDLITVKVLLKRGGEKLVRIRTSNYPEMLPFSDEKAHNFARSQVDKWLVIGTEIVKVHNCH